MVKIAEELGYSLTAKRANLKNKGKLQLTIYKKHSKVVSDTPFFRLIEGIESKARHNSYQLIISPYPIAQIWN